MFLDSMISELRTAIYTNTTQQYLIALGVLIGVVVVLYLFKFFAIARLRHLAKRTKNKIDDVLVAAIAAIRWPVFVFVAIMISANSLVVPTFLVIGFRYIFLILLIFAGVHVVKSAANEWASLEIDRRKKADKATSVSMVNVLKNIVIFVTWIVAFLFVLSLFGIKITPLLAGLGVGGIAIAFALQNVLSDLFASFSIYFDKPFVEGDFIDVGPEVGNVKHIGLKSTRIKELSGEELVVPNKYLTDNKIHNYKKMEKRRVSTSLGVEYGTSTKKLKLINTEVKRIVDKVKNATFDRIHFKEFGDSALIFELVYYIDMPDYVTYMDIREKVNFGIKESFEKYKIEMAFPTQTVHVKKG